MIEIFNTYLTDNFSLLPEDKILLATSGGADSVTMLDLFARAGYKCGVAHCNFQLRGDDANQDEEFVCKLATKHSFKLHKITFNTKEYASKLGISLEMAARDLRYEWFEEIRQSYNYKYTAVAHHKDDIIETFFINLTRGTGIRGLSGIKVQNNHIIRPLLFAYRKDILNYIDTHNLDYREDLTNNDTTIIRNKLRHKILPLLQEINPAAADNIITTIQNLHSSEIIVNDKVKDIKKQVQKTNDHTTEIHIKTLQEIDKNKVYLYELLKDYLFNSSQIQDIYNSLDGESGRIFLSKTHQLVKDRENLIISKLESISKFHTIINSDTKQIDLPNNRILNLKLELVNHNYKIPKQAHEAALDFDLLKFPLEIRTWRHGDYFYPLGMKSKKKLSDFFIDEKYSLTDKQNALLLVSEGKIVWIIGKRIDNRFKITNKSTRAIELKLKPLN